MEEESASLIKNHKGISVNEVCFFCPSAKVPLARSVIGFNILWVKESTKCTLQSELKAMYYKRNS